MGHIIRIGLNIYEVIQVRGSTPHVNTSTHNVSLQVVSNRSPLDLHILVDLSHFLLLFNSSFNLCLIALMVRRNVNLTLITITLPVLINNYLTLLLLFSYLLSIIKMIIISGQNNKGLLQRIL